MPSQHLVLTILGPDRSGLVGDISKAVVDAGGNWLESRMSHLAGHFAGMARIEIDSSSSDTLLTALNAIDPSALQITVAETSTALPNDTEELVFEVVGNDRPGIVADISTAVARFGANVEEMETTQESAPMSGDLHFRARACISFPKDLDLTTLTAGIEAIADDLVIDFTE